MDKTRYGDGTDSTWIESETDDTTAVTTGWVDLASLDRVGVQLLVQPIPVSVTVVADDSAVAADDEFLVAGFDFTGYDGGTVTVSGAEEAANNGTFPIVTGSDGVLEVTGSLADEPFTDNQITMTVTAAATSEGAWLVEVSNNNVPASNGSYGAVEASGEPTSINDGISPALVAVDPGTAGSDNQWVQFDLAFRAIRFTYTPTAGEARVRVLGYAKSLS